ncbi:hypothetical protein EA462_01750 [Natrarchaeobius halalkaliphilus]|uniref:Uncharacterized protein n=1 Tax=Natrarchaeobius halalkaliphilus TaxID=1679091 RepID=A0A3N6LYL5_9EURY|nr:hypothetical protein [Natrarchaeobius halalkaliphilus]RQG92964.1 hypothetical protein EA462_01750 [Natrarchaeobius halalkaliphilus]
MPVPEISAPLPRDILLGVLALSLLTAPLWAGAVGVGDPAYTYDRAEVTTTDAGIEYADPEEAPHRTPISDSIECAGWGGDIRACTFEEHLLEEGAIPTGIHATNPNSTSVPSVVQADYYRYVQIENTVYEPSYSPNTSAQREDGMYRVDMTLEPVAPEDALYWVSLGGDRAPSVVAETAREGTTTTTAEVDVPETPIRLEDETYYRVYQEREVDEPSTAESGLRFLLTYVAPFGSLFIAVRLSRRFHVSDTGRQNR